MSEKKPARNGKRVSKNGERGSSDPLRTPYCPVSDELRKALRRIFDYLNSEDRKEMSPAAYEQRRNEFEFHMTDIVTDMHGLVRLYDRPDSVDRKTAGQFVISFLYHVIPHLNAAGRVFLGDVLDPFAPDSAPEKVAPRSSARKAQ
jgi:hypothetical protein